MKKRAFLTLLSTFLVFNTPVMTSPKGGSLRFLLPEDLDFTLESEQRLSKSLFPRLLGRNNARIMVLKNVWAGTSPYTLLDSVYPRSSASRGDKVNGIFPQLTGSAAVGGTSGGRTGAFPTLGQEEAVRLPTPLDVKAPTLSALQPSEPSAMMLESALLADNMPRLADHTLAPRDITPKPRVSNPAPGEQPGEQEAPPIIEETQEMLNLIGSLTEETIQKGGSKGGKHQLRGHKQDHSQQKDKQNNQEAEGINQGRQRSASLDLVNLDNQMQEVISQKARSLPAGSLSDLSSLDLSPLNTEKENQQNVEQKSHSSLDLDRGESSSPNLSSLNNSENNGSLEILEIKSAGLEEANSQSHPPEVGSSQNLSEESVQQYTEQSGKAPQPGQPDQLQLVVYQPQQAVVYQPPLLQPPYPLNNSNPNENKLSEKQKHKEIRKQLLKYKTLMLSEAAAKFIKQYIPQVRDLSVSQPGTEHLQVAVYHMPPLQQLHTDLMNVANLRKLVDEISAKKREAEEAWELEAAIAEDVRIRQQEALRKEALEAELAEFAKEKAHREAVELFEFEQSQKQGTPTISSASNLDQKPEGKEIKKIKSSPNLLSVTQEQLQLNQSANPGSSGPRSQESQEENQGSIDNLEQQGSNQEKQLEEGQPLNNNQRQEQQEGQPSSPSRKSSESGEIVQPQNLQNLRNNEEVMQTQQGTNNLQNPLEKGNDKEQDEIPVAYGLSQEEIEQEVKEVLDNLITQIDNQNANKKIVNNQIIQDQSRKSSIEQGNSTGKVGNEENIGKVVTNETTQVQAIQAQQETKSNEAINQSQLQSVGSTQAQQSQSQTTDQQIQQPSSPSIIPQDQAPNVQQSQVLNQPPGNSPKGSNQETDGTKNSKIIIQETESNKESQTNTQYQNQPGSGTVSGEVNEGNIGKGEDKGDGTKSSKPEEGKLSDAEKFKGIIGIPSSETLSKKEGGKEIKIQKEEEKEEEKEDKEVSRTSSKKPSKGSPSPNNKGKGEPGALTIYNTNSFGLLSGETGQTGQQTGGVGKTDTLPQQKNDDESLSKAKILTDLFEGTLDYNFKDERKIAPSSVERVKKTFLEQFFNKYGQEISENDINQTLINENSENDINQSIENYFKNIIKGLRSISKTNDDLIRNLKKWLNPQSQQSTPFVRFIEIEKEKNPKRKKQQSGDASNRSRSRQASISKEEVSEAGSKKDSAKKKLSPPKHEDENRMKKLSPSKHEVENNK